MTPSPVNIYWSLYKHDEWRFYLAATDSGLCCMTLPNESFETLELWVKKHIVGAVMLYDKSKLEPYVRQLAEYFGGNRREFTCPLDLRGTPFQVRVWHELLLIPFGKIKSYSEIAAGIGHSTAVRAVGAANGANPIPIVVPCHRVIGKDGRLNGYRGGIDMKADLLALEGL
ncbi:methylated-DNA--[protein]-cysteine S-methyltransferase [Fodinisporobacter ferrooxydans]|uniref:Methylated-DNA--protein-cysteine methyltransferase n=1 Tax=Fodinisporobacter ferrooxydans TaxID=2901836 RepID=A0ABY4CJ52_9BACL|nr:methylated-DNA--[protein]-cysteine S-methyltransferase [Alicyclobacillaceae bacterium MYW30-H2]